MSEKREYFSEEEIEDMKKADLENGKRVEKDNDANIRAGAAEAAMRLLEGEQ